MDAEKFVQNIKTICLKRGIKPTVACKESGVGGSFINDIERGRTPSVAKVQMLADYLGVTTSELLGERLPSGPAADRAQLQAAFWGDDQDLSQEDLDEMWKEMEYLASLVAQRRKADKQKEK